VLGIEAPDPGRSSNLIAPAARARISLRTVPGLSSEEAGRRMVRWITRQRPHGARVEARIVRTVPWWRGDPDHPFQERVRGALLAGFGAPSDLLCAGGSIGFMDAVQRELGSPPCALIGLEDPQAGAHAPDESLHLGVWEAATRSLIHLVAGYSESQGQP
jgi:acetylornithine deacetylase/succinyl-diaminopimelate desuccinylase-like protein